jgi:hypothetical protein
MITDARAQVDLIAALHLESANDQCNRVTHAETAIPHSMAHDSVQLRHRLAAVQRLAFLAQGLTIKTDMARPHQPRGKILSLYSRP